jgi:hypothetical protein
MPRYGPLSSPEPQEVSHPSAHLRLGWDHEYPCAADPASAIDWRK